MPSAVIGVHFVCDNDRNVTDHGDGTFDSGFWWVAQQHRPNTDKSRSSSPRPGCADAVGVRA